MIWLQALLVFVCVAVADFCWARYIRATGEGHRWVAGFWSATIILIGSVSVIEYTTDHRMIVPAAAGAFVGTALSVKRGGKG